MTYILLQLHLHLRALFFFYFRCTKHRLGKLFRCGDFAAGLQHDILARRLNGSKIFAQFDMGGPPLGSLRSIHCSQAVFTHLQLLLHFARQLSADIDLGFVPW